nr:MAG TPA: hypothetical protein [Caudoviricetes sp.]
MNRPFTIYFYYNKKRGLNQASHTISTISLPQSQVSHISPSITHVKCSSTLIKYTPFGNKLIKSSTVNPLNSSTRGKL